LYLLKISHVLLAHDDTHVLAAVRFYFDKVSRDDVARGGWRQDEVLVCALKLNLKEGVE
jgi:hypothetical protein